MQDETKIAHRLSIVWFLVQNNSKILHKMCPETLSFRDTRHCQMGQHNSQQAVLSSRNKGCCSVYSIHTVHYIQHLYLLLFVTMKESKHSEDISCFQFELCITLNTNVRTTTLFKVFLQKDCSMLPPQHRMRNVKMKSLTRTICEGWQLMLVSAIMSSRP
jgi:hypothetical protein